MPQRKTAEQRIEEYRAEHGDYCNPAADEVARWKRADQKAEQRAKEKMARTGSALDIRRRTKDPWNPFSLNIARAKVMLEQGKSVRSIHLATGLDEGTVRKVRAGTYDAHIPAAFLEQCRASEPAKLTMVAAKIVDSILEDPSVIEGASLQQRMTAAAIAIDKRELLEGRPTSRIDHLTNLPDEALQREMVETFEALRKRLTARGYDQTEEQYEDAETVAT